jgi:hypothetical protein
MGRVGACADNTAMESTEVWADPGVTRNLPWFNAAGGDVRWVSGMRDLPVRLSFR